MRGDIVLAGFVVTAAEWEELDAGARWALMTAAAPPPVSPARPASVARTSSALASSALASTAFASTAFASSAFASSAFASSAVPSPWASGRRHARPESEAYEVYELIVPAV